MAVRLCRAIVSKCLLLLGAGWLVCAASQCGDPAQVDVTIRDPKQVRKQAKWAQLVVFDENCPTAAEQARGKVSGARQVFTVDASDPLPSVGNLPRQKFGFAVYLRKDDCSVLGAACTDVDLATHGHIVITIFEAFETALGACEAPEECDKGACKEN